MTEKQPKPGSNIAMVLDSLKTGATHYGVMAATRLSSKQVANAKSTIYRKGYGERPSDEERRKDWKESHPAHLLTEDERRYVSMLFTGRVVSSETRENISRAKGGTWLAIRKYAKMGMFVREIAIAALFESGKKVPNTNIYWSIRKARNRGDVSKLSKKEIGEVQRVSREPWEKTRQRVQSWLNLERLFIEHNIEERPSLREDWLLLIEYYDARVARIAGDRTPMENFSRRLDSLPTEKVTFLQPFIVLIRDTEPILHPVSDERIAMIQNNLVVHSDVGIPTSD